MSRRKPARASDRRVRAQGQEVSIQDIRSLSGASTIHAGVLVTPETAQTFSAVYRAVRVIAGTVASMPLRVYDATKNNQLVQQHPVALKLEAGLSTNVTNVVLWDSFISDLPLRGTGWR